MQYQPFRYKKYPAFLVSFHTKEGLLGHVKFQLWSMDFLLENLVRASDLFSLSFNFLVYGFPYKLFGASGKFFKKKIIMD